MKIAKQHKLPGSVSADLKKLKELLKERDYENITPGKNFLLKGFKMKEINEYYPIKLIYNPESSKLILKNGDSNNHMILGDISIEKLLFIENVLTDERGDLFFKDKPVFSEVMITLKLLEDPLYVYPGSERELREFVDLFFGKNGASFKDSVTEISIRNWPTSPKENDWTDMNINEFDSKKDYKEQFIEFFIKNKKTVDLNQDEIDIYDWLLKLSASIEATNKKPSEEDIKRLKENNLVLELQTSDYEPDSLKQYGAVTTDREQIFKKDFFGDITVIVSKNKN